MSNREIISDDVGHTEPTVDLELDELTIAAVAAMNELAGYLERVNVTSKQAHVALGSVRRVLPRINDAARRAAHSEHMDKEAS